jgi:hypothetical protein
MGSFSSDGFSGGGWGMREFAARSRHKIGLQIDLDNLPKQFTPEIDLKSM